MPELPEVETVVRELRQRLRNKKIKEVRVIMPKMVAMGPATLSNLRKTDGSVASKFAKTLKGQKITDVKRRAKMIIIDLAGRFAILVHLKMTGQLIFTKKGEKKSVKIFNLENARREVLPHAYTHVIFQFSDGTRLFYNDMRQFGYVRVVRDEDLKSVKELAGFGPEPLSGDLTLNHLMEKARRRPGLSIKQFLMDPTVVAGIGNIYSDEILYWAALRPMRRLRSLNKEDFQAILKAIPKVLKQALKNGGSSVGDFFQVDGSEGTYGKKHMVYGRYGEYCKVCGEEIKRVKLGGRTGSYCPHCQK